ncbi:uncharacterized protein [Solanum tuberosum]|uniref:uncharacterized protein n=1 Tax=Solanum tuberosum TaxID=4113 RepID=UPI00073A339D|nr:PREDICTED: uncharacterized protein LOC107057881 [Solanum tuberosum]
MAALLEIKVKAHKAHKVLVNVFPGWHSLNNYSWAVNGRVWIVWNPNYYQITHIRSTSQSIHCLINGNNGTLVCFITVIYAYNSIEQRKVLWAELSSIEQMVDKPWLIAGDFNAVLYPNDRVYGAPISLAETQDFSNCIHKLQLNEVPWKGDYYTWSNKQLGTDRICSRIDRVFGNLDWLMTWGHVITKYDLPYFYDHSPVILTIANNRWTCKVSFRFFNIWAEHSTFMDKVAEIWQKHMAPGTMANIWGKLRALRQVLKDLNIEEFKSTTTKINVVRQELLQIQEQINQQCTDELLCNEKQTLLDIEKWSLVEESALRQKSRAKWIQLGDGNNKYFTAVIKERTNKKIMRELTSLRGTKLNTPEAIKEEVVEFYKALMGSSTTSLPVVDRNTMKKGSTITYEQGVALCEDVMDEEIWKALTSIGDDKAPGVDGYNTYFYKKTWSITKDDMLMAIIEFFQTGKLYRPVNCTVPENLCFPQKFIQWIMECVHTVNYTIMVNGETTPPFNAARGLRQGDHISPYLFDISMEYLSRCLAEFSQASGLQANMNKSSIYFGGAVVQEKLNILQQSGFGCGDFPFKYLCVPLSTKKLTIMQWSPLVNKIIARISSWTAKKLSYAGRIQLVQSVLFGIQAYWSQLFTISAKVLKLIESYCISFTWSGSNTITKRALIAWDKVCLPKSVGGMNLINIRMWNQAAIAKTY